MGDDSKKDQILNLAIELLRLRSSNANASPLPSDFTSLKWDQAFQDALKRAELLIRKMDDPNAEVHAYQVLPPDQLITAEGIAELFKEARWSGLLSKAPVEKLLQDIHTEMGAALTGDDSTYGPDNTAKSAYYRILESFQDLQSSDIVTLVYPHLKEELDLLVEKLEPATGFKESHAILPDNAKHREFINHCYERQRKGEQYGSFIRRYRAHSIFLYASEKGLFPKKLIRSRDKLDASFIPYPTAEL